MSPRLAGLFALGALAIAGCGSSDDGTATSANTRTVDDAQVEQGIEDDLSTSSAKVTSAKCPKNSPKIGQSVGLSVALCASG